MTFFLDTNICIHALKGRYPAIMLRLERCLPSVVKISAMVHAELLLGAKKSDRAEQIFPILEQFLAPLEVVPFDKKTSEVYAEIRSDLEKKGTVIGPNDLIIAATVVANNGILVTHNIREFKKVVGLKIEDWTG